MLAAIAWGAAFAQQASPKRKTEIPASVNEVHMATTLDAEASRLDEVYRQLVDAKKKYEEHRQAFFADAQVLHSIRLQASEQIGYGPSEQAGKGPCFYVVDGPAPVSTASSATAPAGP